VAGSPHETNEDERVVRDRLAASNDLLAWFRTHAAPAVRFNDGSWGDQRLLEILGRAFLTFEATVRLSELGYWAQASMLTRSLFEDVAVAHWLVTHPDPAALEQAYIDHLEAVRWADLKAQEELGLPVAPESTAWYETQHRSDAQLDAIADRFRWGQLPWHRKTTQELINGVEARRLPRRAHADRRIALLNGLHKRMLRPANLALHHSPVVTLQLGSRPAHLLRDVLQFSFPLLGLLMRLVFETASLRPFLLTSKRWRTGSPRSSTTSSANRDRVSRHVLRCGSAGGRAS
jgi:hypothetical protein